jgi:hypothetical protein
MKQRDCRIAPKGKFRIVAVDKFEPPGEATEIIQDMIDKEEAIKYARELTIEHMKDILSQHGVKYSVVKNRPNKKKVPRKANASYSMATVFYVYDDKMNYLGGDAWVGE